MNYRANEIKTGLMIVLSLLVLGLFLIMIFGLDFGKETKEYLLYLDYVGGIKKGSIVKYRGVDAGEVSDIEIPNDQETGILVKLEVDANTPIRKGSRAFVSSVGLMGSKHIEITAGSSEAALLSEGDVIQSKESLSFGQMAEAMGDLNSQLQLLVSRANAFFNEERQAQIASMMGNLDTLIKEGRDPFLGSMANLEDFSGQLAEMSKNINTLMTKNEVTLDELLSDLKETSKATNKLIKDLQSTVTNLESMMESNDQNVAEMIENFQSTSQNLEVFSRILKEQPWLLVRKSSPPERKY
jgi:phospholipid/cholesterol/gamma-HCH transport system substrate-binding protein